MTRNLVTVPREATVAEAAGKMRDQDIGDVLVVDGDGELVAIVTDRDLVVRVLAEGRDPDTTAVYDVATHAPVTLHPEQPLDQVPQIMSYEAVRRLPVVKDGKPVGVLSLGDLAIIHAKRVDGGSRQATAVLVDISKAEGPSLRQAEMREVFGEKATT